MDVFKRIHPDEEIPEGLSRLFCMLQIAALKIWMKFQCKQVESLLAKNQISEKCSCILHFPHTFDTELHIWKNLYIPVKYAVAKFIQNRLEKSAFKYLNCFNL